MAELLSAGTYLEVCEDTTIDSPVWRTLYGMDTTPDIGGAPEQVDVTNLSDKSKRGIAGLVDYGTLEFGFFYNAEETADAVSSAKILESYKFLRTCETEGKQLTYRLMYPDGTGHQWTGSVNVKRNGASVGAALKFTLSTIVNSAITDVTETD